jgi:hypothetical protein
VLAILQKTSTGVVAVKKLKNIYNLLQQHVLTVCGWGFFTATIHVVNDVAYVILLCCRGY